VNGKSVTYFDEIETDIAGSPSNYILMDCMDGVCKQTSGYIVSGTNYYAFVNDGIAQKVDISKNGDYVKLNQINSCSDGSNSSFDDIGKIAINSNKIEGVCIAKNGGIEFKNDNKKYLIKSTTGLGTKTPFEHVDVEYVPVKHSVQYIIRDKFDSGKILFKYINRCKLE